MSELRSNSCEIEVVISSNMENDRSDPASAGSKGWTDKLRHAIDHAAHLLPAQGPITVFIHHNTLHAFEHLPFHEALRVGARVFGNEPYLPENQYRQALVNGRIRSSELSQVLRDDLEIGRAHV